MDLILLEGTIHKVLPVEQKTEKFKIQSFILKVTSKTSSGTYTELIKLQCINDKINMLYGAEAKDLAAVRYRLSGRQVGEPPNEVYFTNLIAEEVNILSKNDSGPIDIRAGDQRDYSDILPGLEDAIEDKKGDEPPTYDDLPF